MQSLERATLNELRFREVNKDIDARRAELGIEERIPYLCECEDAACREFVRLSPAEYRTARVDERHFLLVQGHPFRSGRIVAQRDGYMVVLKDGEAAEVIEKEECGDG
jgi:hypothetical protein